MAESRTPATSCEYRSWIVRVILMTFEFVIPKAAASAAAESAELLMDDQTFAGFYERTSRPLWAYLARVSANPAVADDMLQESYLRFLCAAHPWNDGEIVCRRY